MTGYLLGPGGSPARLVWQRVGYLMVFSLFANDLRWWRIFFGIVSSQRMVGSTCKIKIISSPRRDSLVGSPVWWFSLFGLFHFYWNLAFPEDLYSVYPLEDQLKVCFDHQVSSLSVFLTMWRDEVHMQLLANVQTFLVAKGCWSSRCNRLF